MTSRIAVACIESCDECRCEREVRSLETLVCLRQGLCRLPLLSVQEEEALSRERRGREKRHAPRRDVNVCVRQHSNDWRMKWSTQKRGGRNCREGRENVARATNGWS